MDVPPTHSQQPEHKPSLPEQKTPHVEKESRQVRHVGHGPGLFRILLGLFVVFLGLLLLANQMGWNWNISALFRFWPVFVILAGLSLLGRGGGAGRVVGVILAAVVAFFVVSLFIWQIVPFSNEMSQSDVNLPLDPSVQSARVAVKLGAAKLSIVGGSDALVSGTYRSGLNTISTSSSVAGSVQSVTLSNVSGATWWQGPFSRGRTEANLHVSGKIPVALTVDGGALDADVDVSSILATELTIAAGASTVNLTLGDLATESNVTINAGASTLNISLPSTVGAKLTLESGATSKEIQKMSQVDKNSYESENFASAEKRVVMKLKLGASTLRVSWR